MGTIVNTCGVRFRRRRGNRINIGLIRIVILSRTRRLMGQIIVDTRLSVFMRSR